MKLHHILDTGWVIVMNKEEKPTITVHLPQLERLIKELEKTRKAIEKSNKK